MDGYPAERYPAGHGPDDRYPVSGYLDIGYPANADRYPPGAGYPREPGRFRDTDSLWQAWRILNLADGQEASVTQWAWARVNAIHEAAEREAAAVRQQAGNQIAAIRAAAERDAAATIMPVSGEPGRAADVANSAMPAPAHHPPGSARGPSLGAGPQARAAGAPTHAN
jgi:hypothetical protein